MIGKPKRDVHRFIETKSLEWDVSLVVVHADEQISRTTLVRQKRGVRRDWPFNIKTLGPRRLNRGKDHRFFLAAEQAVLARVWVEAQYADLWLAAANAPHRLGPQFECLENALSGEQPRHLRVTDVRGHKHTSYLA